MPLIAFTKNIRPRKSCFSANSLVTSATTDSAVADTVGVFAVVVAATVIDVFAVVVAATVDDVGVLVVVVEVDATIASK